MNVITPAEALEILKTREINSLLRICDEINTDRLSAEVPFCSIINAKSGNCSEDCTFCAQSAISSASFEPYAILDDRSILAARRRAGEQGAGHFSIVTSGRSVTEKELQHICGTVSGGGNGKPFWCASLGILSLRQLRLLKRAGLKRYHHNLETAETYFPKICTTHTWQERVNTVRNAKLAGLEVCSGGIIGLGESLRQRVDLAFHLRDTGVNSIALNILVQVKGISIRSPRKYLSPADMLKTVAMFAMVCPDSELRLCAGREFLGEYQKDIFRAGVTGLMTGDLLTTDGSQVEDDLELLRIAGKIPES